MTQDQTNPDPEKFFEQLAKNEDKFKPKGSVTTRREGLFVRYYVSYSGVEYEIDRKVGNRLKLKNGDTVAFTMGRTLPKSFGGSSKTVAFDVKRVS